MPERLLIAVALVVVAVIVAAVIGRRRPAPPTQPRTWAVPTQLDRRDFEGVDRPWLVAVFTSSNCASCLEVMPKALALESPELAVTEVSYQTQKDLHQRYSVEIVPTLVVADPEGVVRASFIGVPSATDLWAAVADARNGSGA